MSLHVLLISALVFALMSPACAQVPPGLKDGDTIVFYGDSITHHNHYVAYVWLFYATRYPATKVRFSNAGVGGNRTSSAMARFRQDVAEQKPALVAVLFGMNDGNRKPHNEDTFQRFRQGMGAILSRIKTETKAKVILLTPSYYDHPVLLKHVAAGDKGYAEYNQVLVGFGRYLSELGKENGYPTIDLNAPMEEVTRQLRKADPQATLSRDGIHPLPAGHFVMADAILKGLGVTDTVSSVQLDVTKGVWSTQRCKASNVKVAADGLSFDLLQESLPYPHPQEAQAIIQHLSFDQKLNRERLAITGLSQGDYALLIDGTSVGTFTSEQFSKGIDLATNTQTPQHRQASEVLKIWGEWRKLVKQNRDFREMEKTRGYRRPDGTYPSDARGTHIIGEDNEVIEVSREKWQERFDALARQADEVVKQIASTEARLYAAAQPKEHRYEVVRR